MTYEEKIVTVTINRFRDAYLSERRKHYYACADAVVKAKENMNYTIKQFEALGYKMIEARDADERGYSVWMGDKHPQMIWVKG